MQEKFDVYSDAGHGWCKVPAKVLDALDMRPWDFSSYSYVGPDCLYLEEDCDLGRFMARYVEVTGKTPRWREHHCAGRSRIRSMPRNVWDEADILAAKNKVLTPA